MANIVQYISYKGEKLPLRISYYAIKMFQQETGKEIEELESDISLLEVLLWHGLVAGHKVENKPLTLKKEDMEFILDESLDEFNSAMMSFFPVSTGVVEDKKNND